METKRQRKNRIFGEWLDTVINPVPNPVDFLKDTDIQHYDFIYLEGVQMLHFHITPSLTAMMPLVDSDKYSVDLSCKTAFSYRTVQNSIESPVISPEFVKLMTDNAFYLNRHIFKYINNWVVSKTKWTII